MHQLKTSGRLSPYSATSPNARRNITESTREQKVIVGVGWKVLVPIFVLKYMYIQAIVQEMQAIAKLLHCDSSRLPGHC